MTRAVKAMTQGKVQVTSNSFGEQVLLWAGDAALPGKQSTWKIQRRTCASFTQYTSTQL